MPAKKFGSQIDLQKIPVLGLVPETNVSSSRPTSPVAGQLFYNQSSARLEVYEGATWVNVSDAGVELQSNKGGVNGYAGLDGSSKVPIAQLPTGTTATSVVVGNDARLTNVEYTTNKGQANGYAGLDATSRIGVSNLPTVLTAGITGAVSASRYAGATASGAPTTGTFVVGDFVIDQTGNIWICITSGTPGTWLSVLRFGTTGTTAAAGNDTRLSDQRVPTDNSVTGGTAAGGVKIQANTITDVNIHPNNKDGAVGTASMRTLGTGALQAASGADARFTDSRTPTGTAGGSLSGTYPNPGIATSAITDVQVHPNNKDGAIGLASMRTLGNGAQQAMPGNYRLDQVAIPTNPVSMNNMRLTNVATPTNPTDAVNKAYVDGVTTGLDIKASVRVASVSAAAFASAVYTATAGAAGRGQLTAMPNAVDGVTLVANDRVLLKDMSTAAANGIWVVTTVGTGANGVWDRASDFDQDAEVTAGAFTFVEEGTANADSGWVLATNNPITIGGTTGTALVFTQFSGAGSIIAGNGLTKSGNTVSAVGTANRIVVTASGIDIDPTNYVGQTSITTLGTVATGVWNATAIAVAKGGTGAADAPTARANLGAVGKYAADLPALSSGVETVITHNLNTYDVQTQFRTTVDGYEIQMSWRIMPGTAGLNQIGVTTDLPAGYAAGAVRVIVMG